MQVGLVPRHIVLDGDPAPLPKGAHVCCGQMAACIKMPLGTEVGLVPSDFVLDVDPAPLLKNGAKPPNFLPCLLSPNGWMDQDGTWHAGGPQPRRFCVRWGPSTSPKRGQRPSPIFGPFRLWTNGCMHQDVTWCGGRRGLCYMGTHPPQKGRGAPQIFGPCLL